MKQFHNFPIKMSKCCFCIKFMSEFPIQCKVKLHCFTFELIIFLSEFVWTISTYVCLCVCLHVCVVWSSEVERCQCQCSPSVLTLSWWLPSKVSPSEQCCPHSHFNTQGSDNLQVQGQQLCQHQGQGQQGGWLQGSFLSHHSTHSEHLLRHLLCCGIWVKFKLSD